MLNRRIFFGAGATLVNRAVSVALGILLLPSLLHGLSKEEVGLWLLINQSWVAMSVLDFGLTTALQRRVGMVLASSGYLWDEERGSYPLQQVANAVHTVKRILSFVALATFFLCSIGGLFYLNAVAPDLAGWPTYAAWILLCASQALLLWSASTMSLLAGAGHIGWDSIIAAATSSFILVTQIVLVLAGGGILAMAVAAAIGALLQRCAIMRVAVWKQHDIHSLKGRYDADCIKSMLGPALRGWVTNLGYVVLTSVDQFMIASNSGLQELPGYRAATLLILNCYFLSGALSGASFAFYSQLWAADDKVAVRDLVERNTVVGIVGTTCSCTLIVVMGPGLFDAWLGTGNFVGTSVLVLVSSVYIIEIYANSFAHAARATNDEAFASSSIAAAVVKIILAILLMPKWGLAGLVLSTLIGQLVCNYWFMVYRGSQRIGFGWRRHLKRFVLPAILASSVTWLSCTTLLRSFLFDKSIIFQLCTLGVLTGAIALIILAAFAAPAHFRLDRIGRKSNYTPMNLT